MKTNYMATYHWHHIVPRHAGGTDDPSNLVRVTVEEHAELHFARYLQHGEIGDWVAANTLSGQMTQAEAIAEARRDWIERHPDHHRKAGQVGGKAPASEKAKQVAKVVAAETGRKPWWNNGLKTKGLTHALERVMSLGNYRATHALDKVRLNAPTVSYCAYRKTSLDTFCRNTLEVHYYRIKTWP